MKRGSITVFAALAFMLVASFLFALLEAGRVYVLDAYADMTSELGVESVCAEYQPKLWQDYGLLCLDGAYGGQTFSADYVEAVLGTGIRKNTGGGKEDRIMTLTLEETDVGEYQLLTDQEGSVFFHCIANYMKKNLSVEAAQILRDRYEKEDAVRQGQQTEGCVEKAQAAVEEARRAEEEGRRQEAERASLAAPESGGIGSKETSKERTAPSAPMDAGEDEYEGENPLEIVLALKQNAFLGMVTEGKAALSDRQVEEPEMLKNRLRERGNMAHQPDADWYERVLVLEYLDQYFADYMDAEEVHALAYEMEYVLCGKASDRENLEQTAKRLLLIREAANVTHILGDREKREASLGVAGALAGVSGNPAVIKVVQIGVVAAWAYVESILDLRALLCGNKIALLKTEEQWTTGLDGLADALKDAARAKDCENGFSYQDYLKSALFLMEQEDLAYRMMDVMEWNLRHFPAYQNCRMDHMICRIGCQMQYTAEPLFWDFSVLGGKKTGAFTFCSSKNFSYEGCFDD